MLTDSTKVDDLLQKDDFTLWVPGAVEILEKAEGESDPNQNRRIGGLCSTESLDRQGEVVVAKGLDFSQFVKYGFYNDNHKQDTDAVLGYPTSAKFVPGKGWYTEGYLLNTEKASRVFELAKALKDTPRRLGFSIEGKVIERAEGNKILRAVIRHVAITNSPVNTDCTWDILSKAFAPAESVAASFDGSDEDEVERALAAGHGNPALGGGAVLRPESIEKKRKVRTFNPLITRKSSFSSEEAVEYLRRIRPSYSGNVLKGIVSLALRMKGER